MPANRKRVGRKRAKNPFSDLATEAELLEKRAYELHEASKKLWLACGRHARVVGTAYHAYNKVKKQLTGVGHA